MSKRFFGTIVTFALPAMLMFGCVHGRGHKGGACCAKDAKGQSECCCCKGGACETKEGKKDGAEPASAPKT